MRIDVIECFSYCSRISYAVLALQYGNAFANCFAQSRKCAAGGNCIRCMLQLRLQLDSQTGKQLLHGFAQKAAAYFIVLCALQQTLQIGTAALNISIGQLNRCTHDTGFHFTDMNLMRQFLR